MAQPAMHMQHQQQRGTLVPGQTISVNKYAVQVERYLSQGGFAHVYLVRTAALVYNTTQHVLKRIAVPNEAMLSEVKKEVDIMRILRGHPNIVYLIDAAWHRMQNGTYEVFILMEFCPGGGIIDMMNRRLRERLSEAEILQIFADVCEGVAAMHNLRPALLHRDLKVENILQASPTSFKLCDFGSATPVAARPPSTTHEIRALEADLNKHTTLQYRAPEMVDPYLRRAVDEKSDVWALGVLLYKLCYYTTPFEEHGVLAILNVQYKIPPYPVYSPHLNALIGSMLREHGAQRPSVFEILETVHRMRGTKSRFNYNPPPRQPLSPRTAQPLSPRTAQPLSPSANALDNVIVYKSSSTPAQAPSNGIQAREKVLEAIAPMRRGRRTTENITPSQAKEKPDDASSPTNNKDADETWGALKASTTNARTHKSGFISGSSGDPWRVKSSSPPRSKANDAWSIGGGTANANSGKKQTMTGLSYNFSQGFGDSFDNSFLGSSAGQTSSNPIKISPADLKPRVPTPSVAPRTDAFESLSVVSSGSKPATPTLGEAQRSGLTAARSRLSPALQSTSDFSLSPSPSPIPGPPPRLPSSSPSPQLSAGAIKQRAEDQSLSAEMRFPALEELDANHFPAQASSFGQPPPLYAASAPPVPLKPPSMTDRTGQLQSLRPGQSASAMQPVASSANNLSLNFPRQAGVRSQQVTGTAMRESQQQETKAPSPSPLSWKPSEISPTESVKTGDGPAPPAYESPIRRSGRPALQRKHRSSVSIKLRTQQSGHGSISASDSATSPTAPLPHSKSNSQTQSPHDWLTGEDSFALDNPVLRASPEKRISLLPPSYVPMEAAQATHETGRSTQTPLPAKSREPGKRPSPVEIRRMDDEKEPAGLTENWSPVVATHSKDDSSDEDEGPEDAGGYVPPLKAASRRARSGRQSSVHELVDLWSGGPTTGDNKANVTKHNRRVSAIKSPMTTTTPETKKEPTTPIVAAAPVINRKSTFDVPSNTPENKPSTSRHHRKQPSASVATTPTSATTPRSRPQSMLVFPMQKATSDITPVSATPVLATADGHRSQATPRRNSISDMVSRFEAIGIIKAKSSAAAATTPTSAASAASPARLKVATPISAVASPTAASTRFPAISPASSPTKASGGPDASLRVPRPMNGGRSSQPYSQTPAYATPPRLSPVGRRTPSPIRQPIPAPATAKENRLPPRSELLSIISANAEPDGSSVRNVSETEEPPHSPSPEKPYQGVSKLIDQWQKKSEGAEGGPRAAGRSPGGVSRFRKESIATGAHK